MGRDTSESDSDVSSCQKTSDFEDHIQQGKECYNREKHHNKCDFEGCNKTFYRPSKLEAHKRLHKGQRPFVCTYDGCRKAYTNSSHLKRHVKVSHEKSQVVNSFRCPEPGCEVVLRTRQCLKKHIKRKHTDFPYECPECKAKFKKNNQLKEHIFLHTGVLPFVCELCKKGFKKSYDLKKHQRCHRTYTCGLQNCSVTFPTVSLYRKHMASVHKPNYVCALCDKKFTTQSSFKSHHLTHVNFESWECPHENCNASFAQEKYLKQHFEHVHNTSHQWYKCPVANCQRDFKWKRSLFHHVKLHSIKNTKKSRTPQKERKDKGQHKKSMAAELANVTLQPDIHKEIISKESCTFVDSDSEITFEEISARDNKHFNEPQFKNDIISFNNNIVDKVLIGKETFYRIENVTIEMVSDFDENDTVTGDNEPSHNSYLVKDNVVCDGSKSRQVLIENGSKVATEISLVGPNPDVGKQ